MGIREYLLDSHGTLDLDELDLTALFDTTTKTHSKKLAISTCTNLLGRTVAQSEFRVLDADGDYDKGEIWYRLNVRPNKNQTASEFWQEVIHKLIVNNEVLIIQDDDENLIVADRFVRKHYTLYDDNFQDVQVGDYEFKTGFRMSDVLYLHYSSENMHKLFGELYNDYGALYERVLEYQKRKNQIRSTVNISQIQGRDNEQKAAILQSFVDKTYAAIKNSSVAIIPQQKGIEYKEHNAGNAVTSSGVEEINKATDGYLDRVAVALGIPPVVLHGEMANAEGQIKNYLKFTINPLLKMIKEELTAKLLTKSDVLAGKSIEVKSLQYRDIFDIASAIDKIVSSGAFTGNEVRHEAGYARSDDPNLDKHFITKNYTEIGTDPNAPNGVSERSDSE